MTPGALRHGMIVLATVALDQATKIWARETLAGTPVRRYVGDMFRLQYAENSGGFLSLGANLPEEARFSIFVVISALGLGLLAWVGFRSRGDSSHSLYGLTMVIAGGASNLYDRLVNGGMVIDFMNTGIGSLRTGVFNIADMAILAGTGWLLWDHFRSGRRDEEVPKNNMTGDSDETAES